MSNLLYIQCCKRCFFILLLLLFPFFVYWASQLTIFPFGLSCLDIFFLWRRRNVKRQRYLFPFINITIFCPQRKRQVQVHSDVDYDSVWASVAHYESGRAASRDRAQGTSTSTARNKQNSDLPWPTTHQTHLTTSPPPTHTHTVFSPPYANKSWLNVQ